MIVDEVKVYFKAGDGGEGGVCFIRFSDRRIIGGGGDGGKGGDIILKASEHLYDLHRFLINKNFIAEDGQRGGANNKKGKGGEDLVVEVPLGTMVKDLEGNVIVDLLTKEQTFLICRGGRAGKGNFKKRYSLAPQRGEKKELILDYRIPNDIAILGFPNSGKTSLFNKLTGKSFKVADYPFTTGSCAWAKFEGYPNFTVLDTPPLKDNLKHTEFLKHLWRAKVILLLSEEIFNYAEEFAILKKEILRFDAALLKQKKVFYLLTKVDKIDKLPPLAKGVLAISAKNNLGIAQLRKKIIQYLKRKRENEDCGSQGRQ